MELLKDNLLGYAFVFIGGFLPSLKPKPVDLTGKIAVVTGGNSGIGYGFALQLAEMGAMVFLACRNERKAERAREDILRGCPGGRVEIARLDTASLDSVRAFARNWKHGKIDILAHNAGVSNAPKGQEFTKDGFEYLYQVNFLSSFLLTKLLVRDHHLSEDARVIFTSSIGSYAGSLSGNFGVEKVQFKSEPSFHGTRGMHSYAQTKLMQAAYARALQSKFDTRNPTNKRLVFSWEPGLVKSNLLHDIADRSQDLTIWLLSILQPIVGLDVRQGSATGVYLATSDEVGEWRGRYFDWMRARAHPVDGYTREKGERLVKRWEADCDLGV